MIVVREMWDGSYNPMPRQKNVWVKALCILPRLCLDSDEVICMKKAWNLKDTDVWITDKSYMLRVLRDELEEIGLPC